MGGENLPQLLVEAIIADFPDHKEGTRPIHTIGVAVSGHFRASEVAKDYCDAEHFKGHTVPVTVRFSNGSGSPEQHDSWSDVRGMATRFYLQNNAATDLIAMTLREFFTPTVNDFLEFCHAARMTPIIPVSPWCKLVDMLKLKPPLADPYPGQTQSAASGILKYANANRFAQLAVFDASTIGAPISYVRAIYNAVHTFIVTAPDRRRRYVRFLWRPVAGVKLITPDSNLGDDYLKKDLCDRLAHWPEQFVLEMMIGESGDAVDDPTIPWPMSRVRVIMGTLTLTSVPSDQTTYNEKISFNPCRLVPGLDLSGDPILAARKDAYEYSRKLRGGTACPF